MKNILVLLAAFTLSTGVASAQSEVTQQHKVKTERGTKAHKTPEQRAAHSAKHMARQLGLSAQQTEQVRQLQLSRYQAQQGHVASTGAVKSKGQKQERKASKALYQAKLQQILSKEQYAKFEQLRADQKAKKMAAHKAKV
ncbi:hypothetical protein PK28_10295 [Hymenobacter sp. DG25B]|uniref:hypothetical protein n=1 Tax=Hymenobacter sp. DG25B TaxID=1385664 RepID=UPI000540C3C5|nr:hypothetical protein [Hymenobacter sp. DG25B]AIZ63979.1 hypothetical protein PK28_10295 [Hymenobacter sp. DG25B]